MLCSICNSFLLSTGHNVHQSASSGMITHPQPVHTKITGSNANATWVPYGYLYAL